MGLGDQLHADRQAAGSLQRRHRDRQMLQWAGARSGATLGALVLHDDAEREYAYGPADGLPDTKIGAFPQDLMDEAKASGWVVISMKDDWKQVFPAPK